MTATRTPPPGAQEAAAAPATAMREVLAGVLGSDDFGDDENFFEVLGADSMVMARFCARARKHPDLPTIAMADVYRHPTVGALAAALDPGTTDRDAVASPAAEASMTPVTTERQAASVEVVRPGSPALCGTLQLAVFLGYSWLVAVLVARGYAWLDAAPGPTDLYARSVAVGAIGVLALVAIPVVAKWVLVGRWREQEFGVWTLRYLRFWVVKTLVRTNPVVLLHGSPIYVLYLRALGARIGRGATILSEHVPVCTDLLTVGAGSIIRKDVLFSGYAARAGVIRTGPVTLGRDVVVGEVGVLDVGASLVDGATLGHASSLHGGQHVPSGETYHGSPARPTTADYLRVGPLPCGRLRRAVYTLVQLLLVLTIVLPVVVGGATLLLRVLPGLGALLSPGDGDLVRWSFYVETAGVAAVLVVGALVGGLLVAAVVPRLLALPLRAGRPYPLYGVHYWLHRAVVALTNVAAFPALFGDSSAIAHYLRWIGYDMRPMAQTGSNFGMSVKQESPFHAAVGRGTVVADGLSIMSADYSSSSFRVVRAEIGAFNFLGNRIAYPAGGRTGANCLLATKALIPVDGPVREGVGLLGSPSFEIPRTVARDTDLAWGTPLDRQRSLVAKNRHNVLSMALHVLVRWLFVTGLALIVAVVASWHVALGALEITIIELLGLLFAVGWWALVQRCVSGLQARAPDGLSIYDPAFWQHERFWKVPAPDWMQMLNGTPYKTVVWRMLGAHVGARVFDDGANLTEKSFTTIGAGATLNENSVIQCHSQEDGAFKSDHVVIGEGVTLGVGSFLHYGTTLGAGSELAADAFLMKGGEVPPGERWAGNPAAAVAGTPTTARRTS